MKLVSRKEWGARPFVCSEPVPYIDGLVVHYSASNADELANHANCSGRVKAIQNYHMGTRGWCDIAYNFLFCKHGYVFEGRGWNRKSGATGKDNSHTVAICFLGDDTVGRDDVTYDGREALGEWLRKASERYAGEQAVRGHRDYMSTACPGNELYRWIRTSRWKTIGLPKRRVELWARVKQDDGSWKPGLIAKSSAVYPEHFRNKATQFITRIAPRYAALLAAGRRPRIRRVTV